MLIDNDLGIDGAGMRGNEEVEEECGRVDGGSFGFWFLGVKFSPLGNWKAVFICFLCNWKGVSSFLIRGFVYVGGDDRRL